METNETTWQLVPNFLSSVEADGTKSPITASAIEISELKGMRHEKIFGRYFLILPTRRIFVFMIYSKQSMAT